MDDEKTMVPEAVDTGIVDDTGLKWYQDEIPLEDVERYIQADLKTAARSVISIGYWLMYVRDNELFCEGGYSSINEYAADRFGFSRSNAKRYIDRCLRFSMGGNSPVLDDRYKDFSKSQLQEMLDLDDEQLEQVTPDMTVRQIRDMKKPKEMPYVELPGQISITDFPGVEPDYMPHVAEAIPETASTAVRNCEISVEDLIPEPEPLPVESVATSQQTGSCLYRPEFLCTLKEDAKKSPGTGEDCSNHCCWDCSKRGSCKIECAASETRLTHQLSAYGTPKQEYPADSLIATEGCEGGHYCDSCSMECGIRQEDRWCREAPCGNPFPCDIMRCGLEEIREQVGAACQFINHDLSYHRAGDGEPSPCCKHCKIPCEYICGRAMRALDQEPEQLAAKTQKNEEICCENSSGEEPEKIATSQQEETAQPTDIDLLRRMLEKEKTLLDEMIKVDKVEELLPNMIRKKKILVGALAGMLCDLETPELEEPEQSVLPLMKNNDQRKAWLRDYQSWGLWYVDEHIGARYYKYDFDNGARLIAEEYTHHNEFTGQDYESSYLHLVGGPEPEKHSTGAYGRWQRHETYSRHPNSETELIEFLKALQKGK